MTTIWKDLCPPPYSGREVSLVSEIKLLRDAYDDLVTAGMTVVEFRDSATRGGAIEGLRAALEAAGHIS